MSNTTTPTRSGRGMPVPGIDTHGAAEKPSFSGWPLTPPQSANESRRPSLAFSALSDASTSGPSSVAEYSQPSTPVDSMAHQSFTQQWSEGADIQNMSNSFNEGCMMGQVQPMFEPAFHQPSMCSVPAVEAPIYTPSQQPSHGAFAPQQSPLRQEAWNYSHQPSMGINVHAPGLKTTLFQSTTSLNQEHAPTASMYAHPSTSIPNLGQSVFPNHDKSAPAGSSSMYQPPNTVVPSQLSPQDDYDLDHYPVCKDEDMAHDFSSSFDSTATGYSSWEQVGQTSPHDAYYGPSDEDDYIMVKDEMTGTPSRAPAYRTHRYLSTSSPDSRVKRRSSKRSRKGHATGKVWHEFESPHCQVRYEGKPFYVVGDKIIPQSSKERKPHQCQVVENGEACGASFERSEHLKRHMGKHSNVRAYPCPLDGCGKAIGRPDNAGDHFKTHLKPPSKGKRNKHCDWETLENALLESYNEKQSTKLLTNLRKWIAVETEKQLISAEQERMRRC